MPNYQEGKIYKIYNTVTDDIYIGSTTQKLCARMRDHRKPCNVTKHADLPIYKSFIEHGMHNFFIELAEKCPCNDKDELRKKEGEYVKQLKPSLNLYVPGRTNKEYKEDNKERIEQQQKLYREENKEKTSQAKKIRYQTHKEAILQKQKQYREENKEKEYQRHKTYYEENKEELNRKQKERRATKKQVITETTN